MGLSRMSDEADYFEEQAAWQLCYVLWPRRCDISGCKLWPGTLAYRGRAMYTGPGEPIFETRWHDRLQHIIWEIKRK